MSGEELAEKVGYKTQSGIANLENRVGSSGGHKLPKIAEALNFSVGWFLSGPDVADMSQVPAFDATGGVKKPLHIYTPTDTVTAIEAATDDRSATYTLQTRAYAAIKRLNEEGLIKAIDYLEMLADKHAHNNPNRAGISLPATKAA